MICSALQWVVDRREQQKSDKNKIVKDGGFGSDDEPEWMRNFTVNKDNQAPEKKIKKKEKFQLGFRKADQRKNHGCCIKKEEKYVSVMKDAVELSDEEFLLEEYESEEEGSVRGGKSKRKAGGVCLSSSSDEEVDGSDEEEDEEEKEKLQVYFCSRTHSQLSQFIKELRKTVFANEMKVVSLGSRKNFCINEGLAINHSLA